jgi:hypothetical protein
MALFGLRLEQHAMRDYNAQHAALHAVGLYRHLLNDDGVTYRLQTGEYCGNFTELSAEQVRQIAYDAVLKFWPGCPSISCFKADDCAFSGLTPVSNSDLQAWHDTMCSLQQTRELRLKLSRRVEIQPIVPSPPSPLRPSTPLIAKGNTLVGLDPAKAQVPTLSFVGTGGILGFAPAEPLSPAQPLSGLMPVSKFRR